MPPVGPDKPREVWVGAALFALLLVYPLPAGAERAEEATGFWFRSALGLSAMVSQDQLEKMGYDQVGFVGDAQLAYALLPWLDPYGGVTASAFMASPNETGGLLAPNAGLMASLKWDGYRPYALTDIGVGFTGAIVRPLVRMGIGIDVSLSRAFALGPTLGYGQLIQYDVPGASTDARFFWAGLALQYRARSAPPTPAPRPRPVAVRPAPAPEPRPEPVEPSPEIIELIERTLPPPAAQVELLAPVLFDFDSDELEPVGVAMLHEVALVLRHRVDIELVEVQGYADDRGSRAYNRELSRRRAARVRQWLVEHGVQPERLQVAGLGDGFPIELDRTESAHEQNRRVVFRVVRMRRP